MFVHTENSNPINFQQQFFVILDQNDYKKSKIDLKVKMKYRVSQKK